VLENDDSKHTLTKYPMMHVVIGDADSRLVPRAVSMTDSLVLQPTPEEREYLRYLIEVEARKQRAAALQDELTSLRLSLGLFEAEYHAVVGTLFLELDRIRIAIRAYKEKIARLHDDPHADPTTVEREVEETLHAEREEINEQERENRRYEEALQREQKRPQLPTEDESELHRLYRDLAKRFHPDLARTEVERQRRQPLMQKVNAAMRERDLSALRALLNEAEVTDVAFEVRSVGEKLVWAIREIARLDAVIAGLEVDLSALRVTESYGLWQREEAGERVTERLTDDLRRDIAQANERLAEVTAAYRHLLDQRV
jgi:hypothetical protein